MDATLPENTDTIMLFRNVHFEQVANVIGIDIEKLRMLNPQYRRDIVTGYVEPTDLRLPKEYISKYIEMEDSIMAYNVDELMKRDMVEVNKAPVYKPKRITYSSKRKKALRSKKAKRSKGKKVTKGSKKKKKSSVSRKKTTKKMSSAKKKPSKKKKSTARKKSSRRRR